MAGYFFGEIVGAPVGTSFPSREAAKNAGVHRVTVQGISGNGTEGAESISINGGYEDDVDLGDVIDYTGAGGNDPNTGKQIADQSITQHGNAGLVVSQENGLPVRVMRGYKGDPQFSPSTGYRYDGLYRVDHHWSTIGKSGFRVWKFRLVRLSPQEAAPYTPTVNLPTGTKSPRRTEGVAQRIVRSTAVSNGVKRLHDYTCQFCDVQLSLPVGHYAEGAHIRPLGRPHNGPDVPENVLCLCANHHALFDLGGVYVDGAFWVRDHQGNRIGPMSRKMAHAVDAGHLKYHREMFGY